MRRVRAAFFAAADRSAALCRRAAVRAWRASAGFDAACLLSLFRTWVVARLRLGDVRRLLPSLVRAYSRLACCRVFSGTVPLSGGGSFSPARRALERPMAIACLVERAPCFPSRMCSISSRTNSPACVDGALPCRFALCARSIVFFSGITEARRNDALRLYLLRSTRIALFRATTRDLSERVSALPGKTDRLQLSGTPTPIASCSRWKESLLSVESLFWEIIFHGNAVSLLTPTISARP